MLDRSNFHSLMPAAINPTASTGVVGLIAPKTVGRGKIAMHSNFPAHGFLSAYPDAWIRHMFRAI